MNHRIKNISTTILAIILIETILTLNVPFLIHFDCSDMEMSECICNEVNEENSCCEETPQAKLTVNSTNRCGCYISEAKNNSDFYDNQNALGNKINTFDKIFYTVNTEYNYNNTRNYQANIHSPPLILNSPVYISIHSLLI